MITKVTLCFIKLDISLAEVCWCQIMEVTSVHMFQDVLIMNCELVPCGRKLVA